MTITFGVLAYLNQSVSMGDAARVILPSTTAKLGILPGHVSLLSGP